MLLLLVVVLLLLLLVLLVQGLWEPGGQGLLEWRRDSLGRGCALMLLMLVAVQGLLTHAAACCC
jgi:hypothetical protein